MTYGKIFSGVFVYFSIKIQLNFFSKCLMLFFPHSQWAG